MSVNPWRDSNNFSHIDKGANNMWAPRPVQKPFSPGTAAIHDDVIGGTVRDGELTSTHATRVLHTSVHEAADSANKAANVSYDYALHPVHKTRQRPHEITEHSIVSINGAELTVRDARAIGWMPPATSGNTGNPKNDLPPEQVDTATEDRSPEHEDLKMEAFEDESADVVFTEIINGTEGSDQIAAVKEIVEDGDLSEHTLNALATKMQMEGSTLREKFAPVLAQFEAQARAVMAQGGVESEDVLDYARAHQPQLLREAMNEHGMERKTTKYAALRTEYLAGLGEHDPDTALAAKLTEGWSSYKDDKGKVVVRMPTGETLLWKEAIKAFSKHK